jgi:hypothetical protein
MRANEIVTHADRMSGMEMITRMGSANNVVIVDHIIPNLPKGVMKREIREKAK